MQGTATGTALGYVGNKTKELSAYIDNDGVLRTYPNTSTIKPYEKITGNISKEITIATAAFDIANTWDSSSKLTLGQKAGKTALQLAGIGAAIAVGAFISGPLLASATGGWMATAAGFAGAGLIDYVAGSIISSGQSVIYRKYGLE